jgi:hypothetical protein
MIKSISVERSEVFLPPKNDDLWTWRMKLFLRGCDCEFEQVHVFMPAECDEVISVLESSEVLVFLSVFAILRIGRDFVSGICCRGSASR